MAQLTDIFLPLSFSLILTGGQLKTKNGQKYVFNGPPSGVYVSKACLIISAFIMVAALISSVLLTYFLASPKLPIMEPR